MRIPSITFIKYQPSFINTQGTKRVIEEPKGEDSDLLSRDLPADSYLFGDKEKRRKPKVNYYFELFKQ